VSSSARAERSVCGDGHAAAAERMWELFDVCQHSRCARQQKTYEVSCRRAGSIGPGGHLHAWLVREQIIFPEIDVRQDRLFYDLNGPNIIDRHPASTDAEGS